MTDEKPTTEPDEDVDFITAAVIELHNHAPRYDKRYYECAGCGFIPSKDKGFEARNLEFTRHQIEAIQPILLSGPEAVKDTFHATVREIGLGAEEGYLQLKLTTFEDPRLLKEIKLRQRVTITTTKEA